MLIIRSLILISLCILLLHGGASAQTFISEISEMTFASEVLECDMPVMVWFFHGETLNVEDRFRDGVDNFAKKNCSKIKTLRMDNKYNVITAQKYNIKKSNTFLIFLDGEEIARSIDIRSEKELANFVNQYVPLKDEKKK